MTIGIIGANGFIGSTLVKTMKLQHSVTSIIRENYKSHKNDEFDIIINANGNSHKYWGNLNHLEDFDKSVMSVYKTLYDFKYKKYVYISSIDAEEIKTPYGLHKYLAEQLIQFHCKDYSIIRIPGIIGKDASKGVIYDILNGNNIFLTSDSTMMLMDVNTVAKNLERLIETNKLKKLEKFYPSENISVEEISNVLKIPAKYGDELRKEYFNYKGDYDKSINYLKNIL